MIQRNQGFTIVELMITIAIIAVLVSIAFPAYQEHTRKARRADAKVALAGLAQAQETYHTDYPTYASALGTTTAFTGANGGTNNTLGCRDLCTVGATVVHSPDGHYILTVDEPNTGPAGFILTATIDTAGAQAKDTKCTAFVINSRGMKASSNTSVADAISKLGTANSDTNRCWQ